MQEQSFQSNELNILVCFKLVPDLDQLSGDDWLIDSHLRVDTSFVRSIINPYDESALELALKLKDAALDKSVNLKLTALTIDTSRSDRTLKNLFALKYDHAVRIEAASDLRFNGSAVSRMIEQYVRVIRNHSVIIMGSQSSEGNNAKTPPLVAERLKFPCITAVTGIGLSAESGCLDITSVIDDMQVFQTVRPPVILAIGNAPNSYIRIPTLKDKMAVSKKEIKICALKDLELQDDDLEAENDCVLTALFYDNHEKACVFIDGESAIEKAGTFYMDYLRERVKG